MVEIAVVEDRLRLDVQGADKLWALKSSLEVPLRHITAVRVDTEIARGWCHGMRMPGTFVPGVITAGTFYQAGKRVFWDVHHPENTIVIELHDERYDELIVEVANPQMAVQTIAAAMISTVMSLRFSLL